MRQKILFFLNLLSSVSLFLACIMPYTTSASLAFFSLAVPLLVFTNILFLIFWLFKGKVFWILPLGILVFGYFTLGSFISFSGVSEKVEGEDTFSILSFNSLGFRGKEDEWKSTAGDSIVKFIVIENPDIVCFQEFDYLKEREGYFSQYPYKYVDYEYGTVRKRVIQAVYSKHKIVNTGLLEFPDSSNSAVFTDVLIHKDTVRIYNLHLESLKIRPGNIKRERSDKLFARLRNSFAKQQSQSNIVRKSMNDSPYRNIVCGDFNSTQFSRVYFNMKGDLKDSFLEKGFGYGATIDFWKFPFRIDYILVDPTMEVLSHKNYDINLSDHEPIMASIKLSTQE